MNPETQRLIVIRALARRHENNPHNRPYRRFMATAEIVLATIICTGIILVMSNLIYAIIQWALS